MKYRIIQILAKIAGITIALEEIKQRRLENTEVFSCEIPESIEIAKRRISDFMYRRLLIENKLSISLIVSIICFLEIADTNSPIFIFPAILTLISILFSFIGAFGDNAQAYIVSKSTEEYLNQIIGVLEFNENNSNYLKTLQIVSRFYLFLGMIFYFFCFGRRKIFDSFFMVKQSYNNLA